MSDNFFAEKYTRISNTKNANSCRLKIREDEKSIIYENKLIYHEKNDKVVIESEKSILT